LALDPAGAIVGLLVLELRDGAAPLLDNVAVAPRAQGRTRRGHTPGPRFGRFRARRRRTRLRIDI
ncbi:MAG: hypothetical protein ACKO7G_00590, partial [Gammaproteobacteria bacterium]